MCFSLIWLISYEFLPGKEDDMRRKIIKEECFTFVRLLVRKLKLIGVGVWDVEWCGVGGRLMITLPGQIVLS